jgi:hypothetical protein
MKHKDSFSLVFPFFFVGFGQTTFAFFRIGFPTFFAIGPGFHFFLRFYFYYITGKRQRQAQETL